jgi:hypothetical protein
MVRLRICGSLKNCYRKGESKMNGAQLRALLSAVKPMPIWNATAKHKKQANKETS